MGASMPADSSDITPTPVKKKLGITEEGWLTDCWYFAATSKELVAGKHIHREILGQPVLLGRSGDGKPFALRDICPHRLVPLSSGRQLDTDGSPTIECPYHGWRFGTSDGVCKHMPSLTPEDTTDPSRVKVRKYPLHEANGVIYIYIAHSPRFDGEPVIAPPEFGKLPAQPTFVIAEDFNAHMDDAVVGLMDPAHVPFVHNQWWWRPPSAGFKIKKKPFEPRTRGWAIARHTPSGNSKLYNMVFGDQVTTEIVFQLPGMRWEVVENEKARFFTLTCLQPQQEKLTNVVQITWIENAPLLKLATPLVKRMGTTFLLQDKEMVNLQNRGMKYQKNMLWIDDIDVQAKWYQQLKREWSAARSENRAFENPIQPRSLSWRS